MMRALAFAVLIFTALSAPARALTVDVSDETIRVTTGFTGANLTVFGTQDQKGDVVIVVKGPPRKMTVRRKTSVGGLWTNTSSREFKGVPSFYETAAASTLDTIAPETVLRENRIGADNLVIGRTDDEGKEPYVDALFENRVDKKLFVRDVVPLTYPGPNLFKARFAIPASVTAGEYTVLAYLFENGKIVAQTSVPFEIVPEGLSADLRRFATQNGFLYGLAGMAMAIVAGWLATVLLKRD